MVIEFLTFCVEPHERDEWLEIEERVWTRFLERQPGFVRKQVWIEEANDREVHAMIEWRSRELWQTITPHEVAAVDADMGPWFRPCTLRTFDVVRSH